MKTLMSVFFLVIFHFLIITEANRHCELQLLKTFTDRTSDEFVIWRGLKDPRLECVRACYYDHRCVTFQHSESSTECRLYAADSTLVNLNAATQRPGVVTYQLQGRGGYGVKCSEAQPCDLPNSDCRSNGGCMCKIGYSFNPMNKSCDRGCETYSGTFTVHGSATITTFNIQEVSGILSLRLCEKKCSALANCRSFDYVPSANWCFPKYTTWLEVPITSREWNSIVVHGQRNCKSYDL